MNRSAVVALGFLLIGAGVVAGVYRADIDWLKREASQTPLTEQAAREAIKGMPLVFQENRGQVESQVKYLVRNGATSMFFTPTEVVYQLIESAPPDQDETQSNKAPIKAIALRQTFVGAITPFSVKGEGELKSKVNYFIGNDESKWVRGAPTYAGIRYEQIYEGIDVIYDGSLGRLDYRFEIQPGANPDDIRIRIEGADSLALSADGALVFVTPLGNMGLPKPRARQEDNDQYVSVSYTLGDEISFSFDVGVYDFTKPVVIQTIE